jgi:hypothetical protein
MLRRSIVNMRDAQANTASEPARAADLSMDAMASRDRSSPGLMVPEAKISRPMRPVKS